jgi:hypothetical protein
MLFPKQLGNTLRMRTAWSSGILQLWAIALV